MRKVRAALLVVVLLGIAACSHDTTPVGAQRSSGPSIVPIPPVVAASSPTPDNPFALFVKAADDVFIANPDITPGHATPDLTVATVCSAGFGFALRHVEYGTRVRALADYGVPWSERKQYEVDNLIPASLGGDDAKTNLWPMPLNGVAQRALKVALGNRLHDLVCSNKLSLAAAQTAMASNWWAAYQLYGRPTPILQEVAMSVCSSLGARAESSTRKPLVCAVVAGKLRWMIVAPPPTPSPSPSASGAHPSASATHPTAVARAATGARPTAVAKAARSSGHT